MIIPTLIFFFFFFNDTATTEIYTLSLHDALPICSLVWEGGSMKSICRTSTCAMGFSSERSRAVSCSGVRSEEHTSELQSPCNLVCRLLLEKKKKKNRRASQMITVNFNCDRVHATL